MTDPEAVTKFATEWAEIHELVEQIWWTVNPSGDMDCDDPDAEFAFVIGTMLRALLDEGPHQALEKFYELLVERHKDDGSKG